MDGKWAFLVMGTAKTKAECYEQHDGAGVSSGPGEQCALAGHRPDEGKPPVRNT